MTAKDRQAWANAFAGAAYGVGAARARTPSSPLARKIADGYLATLLKRFVDGEVRP